MSKKIYIYSTLAADMNYTNYQQGGADMPVELPAVHIKGGAGVANDRFITPSGAVITEITEQQLEYLRANLVFQMHEENGFIQVSEELVDGEKAAGDMDRDSSAPITPGDLREDDQPAADASPSAPAPAPAKPSKKK